MGHGSESFSGSACGKAILTGEHFVLHGSPALALPLKDMRTAVDIVLMPEAPLTLYAGGEVLEDPAANEMLRRAFALLERPRGGTVSIRSEIPLGCGLGSSAALSVALLRGLSDAFGLKTKPSKVNEWAFELEKVAHGSPSGVDNTVVTYEKAVRFESGKPVLPLETVPMSLVIGDTGVRGDTGSAIEAVSQWRRTHVQAFEALLRACHEEAAELQEALQSGNWERAGSLMNKAHLRLQKVGVSHPTLERLREEAQTAGAYGAKLTGAGRGGCILALVSQETESGVKEAMMEAGARNCWTVQAGGKS